MKRFLSVLLALAVAFTFTFGSCMSAFAAPTAEEQIDAAVTAQTQVDDAIKAYLDTVVYDQAGYVYAIGSTPATADQKLVNNAALAKGAAAEEIPTTVRTQRLAATYTAAAFDYSAYDAAANLYNETAYLEMFAVEKAAVKALTDKATITAADEAAYTAAKDASDAYDKKYNNTTDELSVATALATIKTAIDNAKYSDAAKALNAIPETVTVDDKAVVEAARAAYDALSDAQKAALAPALVKKLTDAEATIAELTKYTDKDAKAAMFDMTYTLSKTKVTSKKYKVTAKAGAAQLAELKDNGYTVKYRFYKKAPGKKSYKLVKTTTTKYYSYAKLTKGKNYFKVKMTVYKADGTVLGSKTKTTSVTIK